MDREKRRLAIITILLLGIIFVGDFATGAIAIASGPLSTTPCQNVNLNKICTDNIQFHSTAIGNSTANSNLITSTGFSTLQNETMLVEIDSLLGDTVVSINDLAGNTFTQRFTETNGLSPPTRYSIWTGESVNSIASNTITISFSNITANSQNLFFVSTYTNVAGFGNATGTSGAAHSGSFPITTEKSGSWIVGGAFTTGQAGNSTCPGVISGPGLVQRVHGCGIQEFPGVGISGDIQDNATALTNNTIFTFKETFDNNGGAATGFIMGAIELIPIDREPQEPNFNNFCTTINGLCVTTQYSLNFATTNTAPTENAVLTSGTAYCSGLTSFSITTTVTRTIFAVATFAGNDRNVTGASVFVQLYLTTVAPSTVFGAGQCSASQTQVGEMMLNWSTFVGTGAANSQSGTVSGEGTSLTAGTWYGYVEITPFNFGAAGHLQWLASPAQPYNIQKIMILEMK